MLHNHYIAGLLLMSIAAVVAFFYLHFFVAPYGRYYQKKWGPVISDRWGWVIMESPAVLFFIAVYWHGEHALETVPLVLLALWQFHYIYRAFVYPFRLSAKRKQMAVLVMCSGFLFNCVNAYLNAHWLTNIGNYPLTWLTQWNFILGAALFFTGFYIHYRADLILIRLRAPGETGYKIPQGFLYRWICSPNHLGEMITWIGFALASWSLAAAVFAFFTVANLAPRAASHLRWYRSQFPDFPKNRKALVPFVF